MARRGRREADPAAGEVPRRLRARPRRPGQRVPAVRERGDGARPPGAGCRRARCGRRAAVRRRAGAGPADGAGPAAARARPRAPPLRARDPSPRGPGRGGRRRDRRPATPPARVRAVLDRPRAGAGGSTLYGRRRRCGRARRARRPRGHVPHRPRGADAAMTAHILPDWLSEPQRRAILSPAPRLQIVAGAGSGKTEVLARRVVRLLVEGVDPASIIAFTFTEKAAAELKARIETRAAEADERFRELPPVGRGLFIGTTHGWALRALQELGGAYELCDALTEEQEWALVYRVARRLGVVDLYAEHVGPGGKVAVAPAVSLFLRSAEVVHNERLERETVREVAPRFAEVLERYEWLLGEMRLTPFRLMIARAADELAPGGRLHERLRGRVAHVFVDEYQDFNRAQEALLERLAALGAAVTVVGDDDQAIYQWRGGDVSLF